MIPFSILAGQLHTNDGQALEIRVLDLSPESFTFRLPLGYLKAHGGLKEVELSFYSWEKQEYEEVELTDLTFELEEEKEYWEVCRVDTKDEKFIRLSRNLSREYLHYIDLKCSCDDAEIAEALTGIPADGEKEFCRDYKEQLALWTGRVMQKIRAGKANEIAGPDAEDSKEGQTGKSGNTDETCIQNNGAFFCRDRKLYLALENPTTWNLFLKHSFKEFVKEYYQAFGLENHPLANMTYTGIYLGNPYCQNLKPTRDTVLKILDKAKKEGIETVFVLPPLSTDRWKETLNLCKEILEKAPGMEISCNDLGTEEFLRAKGLHTGRGVLLCKAFRDPRKKYCKDLKDPSGSSNLMQTYHAVFLPFYQTNTGTFCPLHALAAGSNRGRQKRVEDCQMECLKHQILYPKDLDLVGRYNSLFGFLAESLTGELKLPAGKERLVINL